MNDIFTLQNSKASLYVARSGDTVKVRMSSKMDLVPQPDGRVHIHDSLAKASLRFTIPPSRYGTQTISVDVSLKPGCQRPSTYAIAVFGEQGGSPNYLGRPPFKMQFTRATRGAANLTVGGELSGFAQVSGTCELEAEFKCLDIPIVEGVQ